jgi:hypothetical protein
LFGLGLVEGPDLPIHPRSLLGDALHDIPPYRAVGARISSRPWSIEGYGARFHAERWLDRTLIKGFLRAVDAIPNFQSVFAPRR